MKEKTIIEKISNILKGSFTQDEGLFQEGTSYTTESGETVFITALEVGGVATLQDGSFVPAGELMLIDGTQVTVGEEGVIQAVTAPSEPVIEEEGFSMTKEMFDAVESRFAQLEQKIAELESKLSGNAQESNQMFANASKAINTLTETFAEALKAPSVAPIKVDKATESPKDKKEKFINNLLKKN
jgi:hypothetical protein